MLKKILSISGKPGLYKMISYGKGLVIVENLESKKRMPAYSRDRIVSLGDISIFTDEQEMPLPQVMDNIGKKHELKPIDVEQYKTNEQLDAFFAEVLPNYDTERVHRSDIKKIVSWYNLLVNAGITDFLANEDDDNAAEQPEQQPDEQNTK